MFAGYQDGIALLSTDAESVDQPHQYQDERTVRTYRLIGGQKADDEGGRADHQQSDHQFGFTALAVADDTEHQAADGTCQEARCVGAERNE